MRNHLVGEARDDLTDDPAVTVIKIGDFDKQLCLRTLKRSGDERFVIFDQCLELVDPGKPR